MDHYFTARTSEGIEPRLIKFYINERELSFYSAHGVFSKDRLDFGSRLLLEAAKAFIREKEDAGVPFSLDVLDLGCGIGVIGIALALEFPSIKVKLTDINERAAYLSKLNVKYHGLEERLEVYSGDKFEKIEGRFDLIFTNPPIRTGKDNVRSLLVGARDYLKEGASLMAVIQKKQGAESYAKIMEEAYGNLDLPMKDKGYRILHSILVSK